RKSRESKEARFKGQVTDAPLNALMATSTLEMGIDVGDLDVTMTAGVPPMPSNFVQRIGRAGRSSGNALIANFAKTQPHDLYFFADPHEMMQGAIHTPGCFL
ncbi:helicase-related protein, partial [Arthrospira platensis SPKY1]|nr:helicase-related protein [Arthrospira platensis SPKY1]